MGLFDNLERQINEFSEKKRESTPPPMQITFTENPAFNPEFVRNQVIYNINNLNDSQLYEMIKVSYVGILEKMSTERDQDYIMAFMNPRFLNVFANVVGSVNVTDTQKLYCNKIAYDYMTTDKIMKDEQTKQIFLNLSRSVNRAMISNLISIGLEERTANFIAMYAASDADINICIRRANLVIISSRLDVMQPELIVTIYNKLGFNVRTIFKNMMHDVYMTDELTNISPDAAEIYGNISLAALAIVEQMPMNDIRLVMIDYTNDFGQTKLTSESRFSINSIAVCDYPRILEIVDALRLNEMIIVP